MQTQPNNAIKISRSFSEPPQKVWQAWTDPQLVMAWFGSDPQGKVLAASLDVQIGGIYTVTFQNSDETEYTCTGQYQEIEPYQKLSFTWAWKDRPDHVEFVTIRFQAEPNGTLMIFEQANIDSNTSHNYEIGWRSTFEKLEKALNVTHEINIREMTEQDCQPISHAFAAQGWDKPASLFLRYWQESIENKRVILIAECAGEFAGYVTIVWESDYLPFHEATIPEIVDFNVFIKFRRQKVGTLLMDAAERRIATQSTVAGLGVCLHVDYAAAQVLYVKRGYIPDGRGLFYHEHYPKYGEQVTIDDDLTLYFVKQLKG